VVEGYEANLGREVTRGGQELFVGLDEGDVEDLAKGIRYLFAGSRYVGCDLCRRGHRLVLVAGVELHVAGLITCWVARRVTSSSVLPAAIRPVNLVVIRSSATINEART
jgi:hypothetical protein